MQTLYQKLLEYSTWDHPEMKMRLTIIEKPVEHVQEEKKEKDDEEGAISDDDGKNDSAAGGLKTTPSSSVNR